MAEQDEGRPLIVRKSVKKTAEEHHGGAWKVAYADFVTAMMAFFLLMWLLNATTEKQRKGLADYFDPSIPISKITAGGAGMLQGDSVMVEGERAGSEAEGVRPRPTRAERGPPAPGPRETPAPGPRETPAQGDARGGAPAGAPAPDPPEAAAREPGGAAFDAAYAAEERRLAALGRELEAAMAEAGDPLASHFLVRMTPEGLVIEIVDTEGEPLFASGSAEPSALALRLIEVLVPVLGRVSNPLAIVGHTDARPFGRGGAYTNWELSADRANAARRLIERAGLAGERVTRVTGRAATEPLADDPAAPVNRRIAITLLRRVGR